MHRTTIQLEGPVERRLRQIAAGERRSFKELINELLRRGLKEYPGRRNRREVFQWHTSGARPLPFFDPSDRSSYLDLVSGPLPR